MHYEHNASMTLQHERTTGATNEFRSNLYMRVSPGIGRHVVAPLLRPDSATLRRHQHDGDFYLRLAAVLRADSRPDLEVASSTLRAELGSLRDKNQRSVSTLPINRMAVDVLQKFDKQFVEQPPDFRMIFQLDQDDEGLVQDALLAGGAGLATRLYADGATRGVLEISPNYTEFKDPRSLAEHRDAFNERLGNLSAAAIRSLYYAEPRKLYTSISK